MSTQEEFDFFLIVVNQDITEGYNITPEDFRRAKAHFESLVKAYESMTEKSEYNIESYKFIVKKYHIWHDKIKNDWLEVLG